MKIVREESYFVRNRYKLKLEEEITSSSTDLNENCFR